MRKISDIVKNKLLEYKQECQRKDECDCMGRITWEHSLTYQSRQVDEDWAIIFICAYHHGVDQFQDKGKMDKEKHKWIALNQAPKEAFEKYYKSDWKQQLKYLNSKYGKYTATRQLNKVACIGVFGEIFN